MHMNQGNRYVTGLPFHRPREHAEKKRLSLKMQSPQIFFFGTAGRQQHTWLLICQEPGEHHTDSRGKLLFMLGGRRRCSGAEASKCGILFSVLSLAPVNMCTKKTMEQKNNFHLSGGGKIDLRAESQK